MHAAGLVARLADLAGVVGDNERPDDEVSDLHGLHIGADLLDHADVLMSHHLVVGGLNPAIGPQVRAADAGRGKLDDRVGGRDDLWVFTLLDPDVASGIHYYATHLVAPFTSLTSILPFCF